VTIVITERDRKRQSVSRPEYSFAKLREAVVVRTHLFEFKF
jgi:hypothetical protein